MNVFELINEDDLFSLTCLMAILYIVGTNMADTKVRPWGWRAGAVAYVVFAVYACARLDPTGASDLACIAFRGLFAAGLTVGPVWMILAIVLFFVGELSNVERRVIVQPAASQPEPSPVDYEQERRERDEHQRQQASNLAKCEELRLECELLYSRYAEQLQRHLPSDHFQRMLDSYFGGRSDPRPVRQRAEMVRQMIRDCVAMGAEAKGGFTNMDELAQHYEQLRKAVETLPYDDDMKDSLFTEIADRETLAIGEFIQR